MTPLRVLIIEDSVSDAALVVHQLEKGGYAVINQRVEDEAQLKTALENQDWDVIIADYQLPEFNAPAALACLQESGLDIPFIVVSGAIGEETAVSLMKSGACDYLMKNKLARLAPVVERELSKVQIRREGKQAEESLRLQSAALNAAANAIVITDREGTIEWVNSAFTTLTGYTPFEAIGNNLRDLITSGEQEHSFYVQLWDTILAGNVWQGEMVNRRKDGQIYNEEQTITPLLDQNGQVKQFIAIKQDITQRKQTEITLLYEKEKSQQRALELERITEISSIMRQAETRSELADIVLQKLMTLIDAQQSILALFDGNILTFTSAFGTSQPWHSIKTPANNDLFGTAVQTGQPVFIEKINSKIHNDLPDWMAPFFEFPTSLIIYPLKNESTPIGLIYLGFEHLTQFDQKQRNLVAAVAEIAGNALTRMSAAEELESMVNRRERELESIYQVTSSASETLDIHQALQQALLLTIEAVNTTWGAIYLLNETDRHPELIVSQGNGKEAPRMFQDHTFDKYVASVILKKKAVVIPELASDPQTQWMENEKKLSFAGLPMRVHDRVIGILVIVRENGEQVILEEMTLLSFIADHLALVVENARLYQRAEKIAVMEERSRLARELHDSVTQNLFSANLHIAGAQKYASLGNYPKVDSSLNQIGQLTQQALIDLRLMVYELRASEIIQHGLISALQNRLDAIERRSNIEVEIDMTWLNPLPEQIEENLYRIAVEALNNSLKHARASKVKVEFTRVDNSLLLAVQDNGAGLEVNTALLSGGFGLTTMRQRTDRMGGSFKVISNPGNGTRIEVKIPIPENLDLKERGRDDQ